MNYFISFILGILINPHLAFSIETKYCTDVLYETETTPKTTQAIEKRIQQDVYNFYSNFYNIERNVFIDNDDKEKLRFGRSSYYLKNKELSYEYNYETLFSDNFITFIDEHNEEHEISSELKYFRTAMGRQRKNSTIVDFVFQSDNSFEHIQYDLKEKSIVSRRRFELDPNSYSLFLDISPEGTPYFLESKRVTKARERDYIQDRVITFQKNKQKIVHSIKYDPLQAFHSGTEMKGGKIYFETKNKIYMLDPKNGKERELIALTKHQVTENISEDGSTILIRDTDKGKIIVYRKMGNEYKNIGQYDGNESFILGTDGVIYRIERDYERLKIKLKKVIYNTTCQSFDLAVMPFTDCNNGPSVDAGNEKIQALVELMGMLKCQAGTWKGEVPKIKEGKITVNEVDEIVNFLQYANHFKADQHTNFVKALVNSNYYEKYPHKFKQILLSIFSNSPVVFEQIMEEYPHLTFMTSFDKVKLQVCLPEKAKKEFIDKLKKRVIEDANIESYSSINHYSPIIDVLDFSDREKRELVSNWSSKLLKANADTLAPIPGLTAEKRFVELKPFVADKIRFSLFGIEPKKDIEFRTRILTDTLDDKKTKKEIGFVYPYSVSTYKRPGSYLNPLGLYEKSEVPFPIASIPKEGSIVSVESSRTKYEYRVKQIDTSNLKKKCPDYSAFLSDQTLTGASIIGYNYHDMDIVDTKNAIQSYFLSRGFKEEVIQSESNASKYVLDQIANGSIDYIMENAHMGHKGVIPIGPNFKIIKFTKVNGVSPNEVHYLVFPNRTQSEDYSKDPKVVDSSDLNKSLAKRKQNGESELTYFNGNCFSINDISEEYSSVSSSNFTPIGSESTTHSFRDRAKNAKKIILDSIRSLSCYSEMRDALEANNAAYSSGGSDLWRFPDEAVYSEKVISSIKGQYIESEFVGKSKRK